MKQQLTQRQKQVLDFIELSINERGCPPTLREIGENLSIRSTNGVNDHLRALERKGYLQREELKSRGLRPVSSMATIVNVPVVGRVAAGEPVLAVENIQDTVKIDRFFVGSSDSVFALRVQGESMINDGIFDGDFIFVRKQVLADPGDIVVAIIDGEATVKRYYPEGNRIRFQPANDAMEPIFVRRNEFRSVDLIGVVVGVYRRV
ncbi:MAG: transcriptional repressor LexA [Pseudomonadota bacterium]